MILACFISYVLTKCRHSILSIKHGFFKNLNLVLSNICVVVKLNVFFFILSF